MSESEPEAEREAAIGNGHSSSTATTTGRITFLMATVPLYDRFVGNGRPRENDRQLLRWDSSDSAIPYAKPEWDTGTLSYIIG